MLWIALEFPNLSLDAVNRCSGSGGAVGMSDIGGHDLMRDLPIVVTDGPATRPILHAINAAAHDAGMHVGMTLASARAMESSLVALPRAPQKEAQCVLQIAAWCSQFTPSVSIKAVYCLIKHPWGSVKMRTRSSWVKSNNSTRIGKRPCNSGNRSEGRAN